MTSRFLPLIPSLCGYTISVHSNIELRYVLHSLEPLAFGLTHMAEFVDKRERSDSGPGSVRQRFLLTAFRCLLAYFTTISAGPTKGVAVLR